MENAIERAVVVADGPILTPSDLPAEVRQAAAGIDSLIPDDRPAGGKWGVQAERAARNRRERESLLQALATTNGNQAEAARLLGMARSTLVSRLKKHGLSAGRD